MIPSCWPRRKNSQDVVINVAIIAVPASLLITTRITSKSPMPMSRRELDAISSSSEAVSSILKSRSTICNQLIMQVWTVLAVYDDDLCSRSCS